MADVNAQASTNARIDSMTTSKRPRVDEADRHGLATTDLFRDQRFAMATFQKFFTQTPLEENRIQPYGWQISRTLPGQDR